MMYVKRLLLSIVACGVISSSAAMVSSQQTNNNFGLEQEKWAYIQENLGKCLGDSASIVNKMGSALNKYAWMVSPAVTFVAVSFANPIYESLSEHIEAHLSQEHDGLMRQLGVSNDLMVDVVDSAVSLGFFSLLSAISYGLCKCIGQALESQSVRCNNVLRFFVSRWDKHKPYAPLAVQPLFDTLYQDLTQNGGRFSKINDAQARIIVENVLAYSVIASIVK
jgi:hypothetical protein